MLIKYSNEDIIAEIVWLLYALSSSYYLVCTVSQSSSFCLYSIRRKQMVIDRKTSTLSKKCIGDVI
jgi:glutathionylspermidine synthase